MKILIVEDEKLLANSLKTRLEGRGFQVEAVYDGESGAEYALLGIYDLLILDVMMPNMDGYAFCSALRNTSLDLASGMLVCGEKSVRLSAREFDVMRFLLQSQERNLSKEVILARVWGYDSNAVENHVEVYVGFLRKKLASIGSDIRIVSIRRLGYHLEAAEVC